MVHVRVGSWEIKKRQQEYTVWVVAIVSSDVLWYFLLPPLSCIVIVRCNGNNVKPICCTNSVCKSNGCRW